MNLPKRKSPRIPGYDYSTCNYYFITICTHHHRCIFGQPEMLNHWGTIVQEHILEIADHYDGVRVDKYIVMPNHIHLILVLENEKNPDCNQIIAQYKSGVSREIHRIEPDVTIWQRSYHDHIIRNYGEYEKIWLYIEDNPRKWEDDCFYIAENEAERLREGQLSSGMIATGNH